MAISTTAPRESLSNSSDPARFEDAPVEAADEGDAQAAAALLQRLVRLASESDSCRPLLERARRDLRRPLAVVARDGTTVAVAPPGSATDRMVSAARGLARDPAAGLPHGWEALELRGAERRQGWLVAGPPDEPGAECSVRPDVLGALAALVSGQLTRGALRSTIRCQRRTALLRRIVFDGGGDTPAARAEAYDLGVRLADCYWLALVTGAQSHADVGAAWQHAAPPGALTVRCDAGVLLLYPSRPQGGTLRAEVARAVSGALEALGPGVQAIVADEPATLARLPAHARLLRRLGRYPGHTHTHGDDLVRGVHDFALDELLEHVGAAHARSFVRQSLGPLIDHDAQAGDELARTLELALEHPRREDAARAGFMHRNTFRRRLQQALDLIGGDLDDPDQRLTLHLALRMHRHTSG
ncbi:MAG: PucR family transcriptional regulator [Thermoleophilia bacterium]